MENFAIGFSVLHVRQILAVVISDHPGCTATHTCQATVQASSLAMRSGTTCIGTCESLAYLRFDFTGAIATTLAFLRLHRWQPFGRLDERDFQICPHVMHFHALLLCPIGAMLHYVCLAVNTCRGVLGSFAIRPAFFVRVQFRLWNSALICIIPRHHRVATLHLAVQPAKPFQSAQLSICLHLLEL